MYISLPKINRNTFLLTTIVFYTAFLLLPTIGIAQYLPANLADIKPLENKLMVKIKSNTVDKLEQTSTSFKTKKIARRFNPSPFDTQQLSLKKTSASSIRLQDWYEI